jgi:hypothetical protein
MTRPFRPFTPKTDVSKELIASMRKAERIVAGKVPPSQVHTGAKLAGMAAKRAAGTGE